jgi:autotransporter translocation and assembly factor TamB
MRLDGEMRRPWLASREVSLRLAGAVDLAALANAAGLDQRIDGKAQIGADITGPTAAPRVAARIRIPALGLGAVTAQDVAIDGEWRDDKLRFDDVQARLGNGRLRGRLEVGPIATGGATISLDLREVCCPDL